MEDHEGNLWVSTDAGMDMFRNLPATNYSENEGLSSDTASAVFVASDGVVWAGAYNGVAWAGERPADICFLGQTSYLGRDPVSWENRIDVSGSFRRPLVRTR